MKKTPFALLREAIETEIFDTSLRLQDHFVAGEKINHDFCLGYSEALKFMLLQADIIARYGRRPK